MGRSVKESAIAGASVRILGEAFRGKHRWSMVALVSQKGLFAAVEQWWRILGGGVWCATFQESHAILPLLWAWTSCHVGASRAAVRLNDLKNGRILKRLWEWQVVIKKKRDFSSFWPGYTPETDVKYLKIQFSLILMNSLQFFFSPSSIFCRFLSFFESSDSKWGELSWPTLSGGMALVRCEFDLKKKTHIH